MKRKISAILAADVAGYSKLVAEDEEDTLRRLLAYREVFDDFVARSGGRIFNTAGDSVLAEFASAVDAVRCAIDVQESFRTRNLAYPASRHMVFRIGITIGDVVEREGDLLGEGVNIAARLEGIAAPGGICVSRSVYEQVANKLSVKFRDIGEQQLKNIPSATQAYVIAPVGVDEDVTPAAPARAPDQGRVFEGIPPRDHHFTGREPLLEQIHLALTGAPRPATQAAICGLGGIGKTSLAAEYAHRHAADYAGAWWAHAEQRTSLVASLAALAARLDPRLADEPDQEKAAAAALALVARFKTPFLLIYDNVETPETVRDLAPTAGARLLLTTRWPDWGGQAAEFRLSVLDPQAAAEFLQKRAGRTDAAAAARLVEALGCLPLALDHAGAYCRLTAMGFDPYRERIDSRIVRVPKGAAYPASVSATFGLAIERASAQHAQAETLLALFAFLAPDRIPLDEVRLDDVDEEERAEALMALSSVSLIEFDPIEDGSPGVRVHRLVQVAMRARVAERGATAATAERATRLLAESFPANADGDPGVWPRCKLLLPHVLALRELRLWDAASATACGELLQRAASYLSGRAAYREAEPLLREAIDNGVRALGPDHAAVAERRNDLGLLLWSCGRYAEAEPLYREAIASGERALGADHIDVAVWLANLARLLGDTGRHAQAEPLYRQAVAIFEKGGGREHRQAARCINNLAILLNETDRNAEAEPLYREALAINERLLGHDHPEVARCINNLSRLLRDTGRFEEAEQQLREALAIYDRTLGLEHPLVGRAKENLARILLHLGRQAEALQEARTALDIHNKTLGAQHRWTHESALCCVDALIAGGQESEAAALRTKYQVASGKA